MYFDSLRLHRWLSFNEESAQVTVIHRVDYGRYQVTIWFLILQLKRFKFHFSARCVDFTGDRSGSIGSSLASEGLGKTGWDDQGGKGEWCFEKCIANWVFDISLILCCSILGKKTWFGRCESGRMVDVSGSEDMATLSLFIWYDVCNFI